MPGSRLGQFGFARHYSAGTVVPFDHVRPSPVDTVVGLNHVAGHRVSHANPLATAGTPESFAERSADDTPSRTCDRH